jgi:hypothetical protein
MGSLSSVLRKNDYSSNNPIVAYNLSLDNCIAFEPKQRAHSTLLAAGLASELTIDTIPYGRRFPVACRGELQLNEKFIESKIDELDEIEPRQRIRFPLLAAGSASKSKTDILPSGRKLPGACRGGLQNSGLIYQLTRARIAELTLICAGNYADNFEFTAAGDLLVNPRCIRVHIDGVKEPVNKIRHLALTDQFDVVAKTESGIIKWLGKNTHLEITKKPLLPDLYERLKNAGVLSAKYLDSVCQRMNKIADVIGFLAAYNLSDIQRCYERFQPANEESVFIKSNLCNFNFDIFFALGHEILKLIENDKYKSVFIGHEE